MQRSFSILIGREAVDAIHRVIGLSGMSPSHESFLEPLPRDDFAKGAGVLIASAAGFGLGLSGLPFYTAGVFVLPLTKSFGWSTSQVQGGLTFLLLSNIVTLPAAAALVQRFGARKVALASLVLFAFAFMSLGTIHGDLWIFDLHWIALSIAGAGTLAVTWTRAISAIFERRRGLALGFAMMGTGLTALIAPSAANTLIERFGWRAAYVLLGAGTLLIAAPLAWFFFWDRTPIGEGAKKTTPSERIALVLDPRFWLLGVPFLFIGAGVAGVLPNLVRLLVSDGYSPKAAAGVASFLGFFVILGRLGGGLLLDRVWPSALAAVFFLAAAAACVSLRAAGLGSLPLAAAAAALGLAAGMELDMLPYLTARYFGLVRLSSALGAVSGFFYLGSAVGPWSFACVKDLTGDYEIPLAIAAGLFASGAAGLVGLGIFDASRKRNLERQQ